MPLKRRNNQFWQSPEEGAGKRCSEWEPDTDRKSASNLGSSETRQMHVYTVVAFLAPVRCIGTLIQFNTTVVIT